MPVSDHPVIQILANELGALRELRSLLNEEQQQLIAGDVDAVSRLTERKTAVVTRMSQLSALRDAAFSELHIGTTAGAIDAGLAALGTHAIALWKELMAFASDAKELNRVNGLLVARQMTYNQSALQILEGTSPALRFYGKDGQASVPKSGRSITAA